MLTAHHLSKSFGVEVVLDAVSFNLNAGERLGLVGPNGCGKTTLLKILAGLDKPDSGAVQTPLDLRIGYLPQGLETRPGETLAAFLNRVQGDLPALTAEVERLADELTRAPGQPALQRAYDAALAQLDVVARNAETGRVPATLQALGLGRMPLDTPLAHLSGGQKTRLALAGALLSQPQLLLLDEPTNHLDLRMLEWMEDWVNAFPGAILLVSHDRMFLDQTVTRILELDPVTHTLREYAGNYSDYMEEKMAEREKHWQTYKDQQVEIAELQSAARHLRGLARFKKGGKADTKDGFARGFFANRGLGTARRAKSLERRVERLLTEDHIDKPKASWHMKLEFGETQTSGQDVLVTEDLAVGYGENVLLRDLNLHIRRGARVVLVGENGAGKTTLLRTIAGKLPPLAGRLRLGANVRVGYMAQEQESLDPDKNAFTTITSLSPMPETEARNFLHYFLFSGDDVFVPVRSLSFGERARLALAGLVAQGCNFLLLDEPINHLDIPARARFEQALAAFDGAVLAVVHDRYFIERFAMEVWEVAEKGLVVSV